MKRPEMRNRAHYLDMLDRNRNASIGTNLAAKMVLAARFGTYEGWAKMNAVEREEIMRLRQKYGETMNREQVLKEMGEDSKKGPLT